jgi:hypothetical protein
MISTPGLIRNLGQADQNFIALEHVPLVQPPYDEAWLQDLIHAHPGLVPAGEVEACFDNLVPVLREFTLRSGYLDNFYVTPDGYPVLVEVKLWKNQEARRKVIAQILEYAKDFSALCYEDINAEIRKQAKGKETGPNPLHEIVARYAAETPDERQFVDRVSRNLREGRFLLLILGDGVREEMAALANYLMHHSLRYSFGIIEIKLFRLPDGSVVALPSVLAKTQTIERHVTVVTAQGGNISILPHAPAIVSEKLEKTSLSLDGFYELMAGKDPQNVVFIKDLLNRLSDLPIDPEIGSKGETLMLKMTIPGGERLQFVYFTLETAQFWGVPFKGWKFPTWQKLSLAYLERIASLVPEAKVQTSDAQADIKQGGKPIRIRALRGRADDVASAIREVISEAERFYSAVGAQSA